MKNENPVKHLTRCLLLTVKAYYLRVVFHKKNIITMYVIYHDVCDIEKHLSGLVKALQDANVACRRLVYGYGCGFWAVNR